MTIEEAKEIFEEHYNKHNYYDDTMDKASKIILRELGKQDKEINRVESILDKVTDKLKEDIKETTLPCVIIGGRRNSKTLEYGKKLGRIETLKEILNIIEREKNENTQNNK